VTPASAENTLALHLFREAFNASPIGIAVESLEGQPLFANPALCSMLGISDEQLRSMHGVEFSPPEDAEKDWELFQQLKAGAIDHYQIEKRYYRKDRSLVWGSLTISLWNSHPSPLVIAMLEDITDKKKTEEELFRHAAIVKSSDDAIISKDLNAVINNWNAAAQRIFGYTEEETVGQPITIIIPPELWDEENKILARLRAGECIDHYETIRVTKTGMKVDVSLTISPIRDATGKIVGYCKIARDITDRKRAEEALFRNAAIVESSDDAISSVTLDGVVLTWNAGAQRMFGYTENEAVGKPASIIVPPELQDQQQNKILERLRAGGRIEQFETVRVSKTGKRLDVSLSISPIKDARGKIVGCAGIARDITKRKRDEEDLLSSEQRYRLLFERNVAGVGIGSSDGLLLDCNDGWARILGYESKDEVVGRHALEFYFNPADRQPLLDELRQQAVLSRELQLKRKDGSPVWVLFNAAALNSEHNIPIVQCTMIDISESKRAEEALSGMTRKLVEAQEQERRRIGRELHDDINQRLAMLSIELELLEGGGSEVRGRLPELRRHLCQISDDVQAISHDLHSSQLEYLGAIAGMKSWCKAVADRRKIEIAFRSDSSGNLPHDVGLPLFRVLQEAVNNATKHSGGKRIEVQLREHCGEIHLIISDSGTGFDVEAAMQGMGLGLTSMRERVRLINGTIAIESKPMGGTSIHVRIPLEGRSSVERLSA